MENVLQKKEVERVAIAALVEAFLNKDGVINIVKTAANKNKNYACAGSTVANKGAKALTLKNCGFYYR